MPETTGETPERGEDSRLAQWLAVVVYSWVRAGIADEDRQRLLADLKADLDSARASGASVDELIAAEPWQFACDVIDADQSTSAAPVKRRGRTNPRLSTSTFVVCALTPFLTAGLVWWGMWTLSGTLEVFGHPLHVPAPFVLPLGWTPEWLSGLAVYAGPACQLVAITTAVVWIRFRSHPYALAIAATAGVALLVAGVIASGVTVAFAATTGYSDRPGIVLTEIVLAVGLVICVLCAAWWLLTHAWTGIERRLTV